MKNFSSIYIKFTEKLYNLTKEFGYTGKIRLVNPIINQSREFHSENLYYNALMYSAYVRGLIYYIKYCDGNNNLERNLNYSKVYFDLVNLTMKVIYNNLDIDAPIPKVLAERAEIHLKEAKKENKEDKSNGIAKLSIEESLIAQHQLLALLDLLNTIEYNISEDSSENSNLEKIVTDKPDNKQFSLEIFIILIVVIIKLCLIKIKKK